MELSTSTISVSQPRREDTKKLYALPRAHLSADAIGHFHRVAERLLGRLFATTPLIISVASLAWISLSGGLSENQTSFGQFVGGSSPHPSHQKFDCISSLGTSSQSVYSILSTAVSAFGAGCSVVVRALIGSGHTFSCTVSSMVF